MSEKNTFEFLANLLWKRPQPKNDHWETVYSLSVYFSNPITNENFKQWDVELQISGTKLRAIGIEGLDISGHWCYNSFIVPWLNEIDYVVLKDGTVFQFEREIHIKNLTEEGFSFLEEMNMDELESLADNLINNKQKETAQGIFAQDFGMMLLSQISSSGEFVEQYFKKDKK